MKDLLIRRKTKKQERFTD